MPAEPLTPEARRALVERPFPPIRVWNASQCLHASRGPLRVRIPLVDDSHTPSERERE